jgi:2-keto-4-pentenoate hydratase/2-oxohepta-3-ene-1,7-dioic acid hydratase in catechol pathway
MKLLRYGPAGREKPGLIDDAGVIRDISNVLTDLAGDELLPDSLARLRSIDPASLPRVEGSPRIGPCVGRVGKFIGIGLNYSDHAAESNMPVPAEPIVFMKAISCLSGPFDDIVLPPGSHKTDWEVELGIVIGRAARYVKESDAAAHIAGYCVVHDVSERSYQLEGTGQWVKGKSADTFGPIGPWLVTADAVLDPQDLDLWLDVNGQRMQNGSTKTMIFGPAFLVSYLSRFMSLQPGDVIATGTPPGVGHGQKPPRYLNAGDEVRLSVAGLGEQRQRIKA